MYASFAKGYYRLMKDNDYASYADFYEKVFEKYNLSPELVLDLGCGAGNLTSIMSDRGYDMIGVDISEEMLNIAKTENGRESILYLCQDMREFELYGTVDVIYSSLDCINYITEKRDLKKVFSLCDNYLNPGGIMIFDLNTEKYFKEVLNGKSHVFEEEGVYLVWQSEYANKKCDFYLDMFYEEGGKYTRFFEEQTERVYEKEDIKNALRGTKLSLEGIYKNNTFKKANGNEHKICCVLRKACD